MKHTQWAIDGSDLTRELLEVLETAKERILELQKPRDRDYSFFSLNCIDNAIAKIRMNKIMGVCYICKRDVLESQGGYISPNEGNRLRHFGCSIECQTHSRTKGE